MVEQTAEPLIVAIEDDHHMADLLRLTLERAGFAVATAADGQAGLELVWKLRPALVVLDLMLPRLNGWEVCRRLRREGSIPILMLTARGAEDERVQGLETGADDYMVKPFSPRELVARVRAILRRADGNSPGRLEFPALTIDVASRQVWVRGQPVALALKEFDLLVTLAREPGRVFKRESLLEMVWGFSFPGSGRTVDEHIRRLRAKIEAGSDPYRYIRTVWGVGYRFEVMT